MKKLLPSLILASSISVHGATVANQIGDLNFNFQSGASELSSSATSLSVQTSKNSFVYADLSTAYSLGIGDSISVSFDMALDNTVADTASSFDFGFIDSTTAGSVGSPDLGYDYSAQLDPVDTSNGLGFREGSDSNLGKYNTTSGFGTATNSFTFTILRTASDTYEITADSNISSSARTVGNDITPLATTSFNRFYFAYRGDAWNEDFGGSTAVSTIDNFSITSTIPEPSSFALLAGFCGLGSIALRRRRG